MYILFVIISYLVYLFTYNVSHLFIPFLVFILIILVPKWKSVYSGAKKPGLKKDPLYITVLSIIMPIALGITLFLPMLCPEYRPEYKYLQILLMILATLGLLLWRQSMDYMGSLFADGIYESEMLITNGPFSLVRNPIYSSYIILFPSLGIYGFTIVQDKYIIIQLIALLLFITIFKPRSHLAHLRFFVFTIVVRYIISSPLQGSD